MDSRDVFEDLFVLEMTNNHQGRVERGIEIIREHSRVVRFNNVRAAIKLQFRDVGAFIHKDFVERSDIYYIKRIKETQLSRDEYAILVENIRKSGCIPMATPFDEKSVDLCVEFEMPIIKVASADGNDWLLLEKIAKSKKPVIVSTGGVSIKDLDDLVLFFDRRNIPLALNHCVAAYPSEDHELELDQIDYLKKRYPHHPIGFSTHEYHDWSSSMLIAFAKGVRLFERHIDIDTDGFQAAKYSSLPGQIEEILLTLVSTPGSSDRDRHRTAFVEGPQSLQMIRFLSPVADGAQFGITELLIGGDAGEQTHEYLEASSQRVEVWI